MGIRLAEERDVLSICNLVRSLSHFYLDNTEDELPSWLAETLTEKAFLSRVQSDDYHNFVFETEGIIVGYLSIKSHNHLYHLFVSEAQQGKGIARKLWSHALSVCESDEYTLRSSLFAVPVYRKFGFEVSGEIGEKDGVCFQPMQLKTGSIKKDQ